MKKVIALLVVVFLTGLLISCEINNVNKGKGNMNTSSIKQNNNTALSSFEGMKISLAKLQKVIIINNVL